ncbi:PucR family transcriptional regulator ligand-binding domain-containing protein [Actinoallomurus spadix]|uniref:Helix-turn-helix domain-containing protein n=1 Tax=Actinoallomurus spadix TaxID=79912 RepID=A0ABN0X417_9ACTN|nr:PucR family transcriptional regulator [Actinoallomurus spadix]MCO5991580.1 PucR family transcriptional regulator ligand-binding domain-containing protein [Actinoallomurus spadix]
MVTIRRLVDDPALKLRVLEPGADGALDAEMRWVHNTELPDPSPYLRDRELVLTNGLWCTSAGDAEAFVGRVAGACASGIVFGLRDSVRRVPAELAAACRRARLPLIELSVDVPFTALSHAVATAYAEERQRELLGRVRRGDALADVMARGAGASGILRVLRRDHDLPLAVVDRTARVVAAAGVDLDPGRARLVAEALTRHPPPLELDLGSSGCATIFLIAALGEVDAGLVCLRPAAGLSPAEQDALRQAASFLSLEIAKRQAVQAIEMRFAGELLDMVLSGSERQAGLPGRLRAFGIDADHPLAVCALAFAGDDGPGTAGLGDAVSGFFLAQGVPVVAAAASGDVVAIVSWRGTDAEFTALARRLVTDLAPRFGGHRLVAGLGGRAPDAAGLRRPVLEAREACRVLRRRGGGPAVLAYHDLNTHLLLLGRQDHETLRRFSSAVLGPLRAHDAARGGGLETSLRAFLDHDGHWAATAAALHVHVNTLRNRMARIAELTGHDVNRTEDLVDLFLALRADALAQLP